MGDFNSMILFRLGFLALHAAGFFAITRCAYGRRRTVLWYLAYMALRVSLFTWTLAGQNASSPFYVPIAYACSSIPWLALAWFLSRGCRGRRALEILAFCNLSIVHVAVPLWVHDHFASFASTVWFQLACCAFFFLIYILFTRLFLAPARRLPASAPWGRICILSVLATVLLFSTSFWPLSILGTGAQTNAAIFALVMLFVFATYSVMMRALAESVEFARASRVLDRTRILSAEIAALRAAQDEARRIRHDFRHHRLELEALLARGDAAGARAYLAGAFGATDVPATRTWSRNELIDVILSAYARRAEARGIRFEATADIPENMPVNSCDLVTVLGNLVENAITASAGFVRVKLHLRDDMLGISVTNSVPVGFRLENGLPCAEPGIGIASVTAALRRHHGSWRYRMENEETLVCETVIPNP